MNQDAFTEICKRLSLGVSLGKPDKVYGGLLHLMWRINTMQGSYAIKQISQGLEMTQEEKDHYETFQKNIKLLIFIQKPLIKIRRY